MKSTCCGEEPFVSLPDTARAFGLRWASAEKQAQSAFFAPTIISFSQDLLAKKETLPAFPLPGYAARSVTNYQALVGRVMESDRF
jgi:hypothetical protein